MRWLPIILILAASAAAAEPLPGPVPAEVVSVYDGDTFTVDAWIWPGLTMRTAVRIDGIDAPELRGRCEAERSSAVEAREHLVVLLGATVNLLDVRPGKYAGRVVARVEAGAGDIATAMITAGHARAYDGGTREGWCD